MSPDFDAAFPEKTIAQVSIAMVDGSTYSSGPVEAIWEPPDALPSDQALVKKFLWLASPVIGEENAEALVRLIWKFDECPTIAPLLRKCAPSYGGGR